MRIYMYIYKYARLHLQTLSHSHSLTLGCALTFLKIQTDLIIAACFSYVMCVCVFCFVFVSFCFQRPISKAKFHRVSCGEKVSVPATKGERRRNFPKVDRNCPKEVRKIERICEKGKDNVMKGRRVISHFMPFFFLSLKKKKSYKCVYTHFFILP
jgi:hypothetical protein